LPLCGKQRRNTRQTRLTTLLQIRNYTACLASTNPPLGQQDIPLIVNNQTISDLLAKAEALQVEILDWFSAKNDLLELA
jgi:hypothetical protein